MIRFRDVLQTIPPSPAAGELLPGVDIIGRAGKGWCSGHRVRAPRGALEALGIPAGEDHLCPLSACSPGRFETDSRAAADHNDGFAGGVRARADWERWWLLCSRLLRSAIKPYRSS